MNTIHAPELRSATERCITTRTGIAIGRCHVRQPLAREVWRHMTFSTAHALRGEMEAA